MRPSAGSSAVGAGVTIVKEGDRVGVPWLYSACGHCEYCLSAWETVCARGGVRRLHQERRLCRIPPRRPELRRPYPGRPRRQGGRAAHLRRHHHLQGHQGDRSARPGEWIAISGAGGLGHLAIQYAKVMGLQVCAVDIDDGKLAHAKNAGRRSRRQCQDTATRRRP